MLLENKFSYKFSLFKGLSSVKIHLAAIFSVFLTLRCLKSFTFHFLLKGIKRYVFSKHLYSHRVIVLSFFFPSKVYSSLMAFPNSKKHNILFFVFSLLSFCAFFSSFFTNFLQEDSHLPFLIFSN